MLKKIIIPLAISLPLVMSASLFNTTTNTPTTTTKNTTTNKWMPTTNQKTTPTTTNTNTWATTTNQMTNTTTLTPTQTTQVQQVIREYLKNNPKVVIDAIMAYRQAEISKYQQQAAQTITANKTAIFNTNNQLVLGNPKGDVTIIEFLDYRCGHCKAMAPVIKQAIQQDKNLKVVVKELPIFGGPSTLAAKAAIAAQKQSRFAKLHDYLLTTQKTFTKSTLIKTAKTMGMNTRRFKKDLTSTTTDRYVKKNLELAKTLRITATPTFIISKNNGEINQFIPGAMSLEQLQTIIKAVRAGQTTIVE